MEVITVETTINAPIDKVWNCWTAPEHVVNWNAASDDWHTTRAENDLRVGGKFLARMEAKDGSFGFDFEGIYENVIHHEMIGYVLADERRVKIFFTSEGESTKVVESFNAESQNSLEMQRFGWQSILDNFKKYVEAN